MRLNGIWLVLVLLTVAFSLLYLWFTLFPGRVTPETWQYFSAGQVELGRQYNKILRLVFIGGFLSQAAFLLWLVFSGRAAALSRWSEQAAGGNYILSLLLFFLVLWLALLVLDLPFNFFSSYVWQHQWGFSTQNLASWWSDYIKSAGLRLVFGAAGAVILFQVMGRWPRTWWLAGAVLFSAWLVIESYLWPVLIAPLFNRFEPAADPAVVSMVQELSQKAGLPVDQVLVMDASRRTNRANAYFAGLGGTRRIVLYDTLLRDYPPDQVRAVVAHEMAHWRQGHIVRGLALGVLGNFALWGLLFLTLRSTVPLAGGRYPPGAWAVILLFFLLVTFAGTPLQNYFSRGMEQEADRVAVMLTGDVEGAVRLQQDLAAKNLSDVAPAPFIRWFSYSHPPAVSRIEQILEAGTQACR
ncbi:MAG TPA: M48 family metallopeptidase [Bacillota bacterium]|nr:M48 family metallopeptidase [Peptococcaceae bacterium MAG4]HPZ44294.1 M48 family metallopeptidase [Bacillota bacterium]HQD77057.1 M48 family metallopeptidase [Bacillota bacterium]HUM59598.1 M48 family metallopeptidase [Bacillota bacterium]